MVAISKFVVLLCQCYLAKSVLDIVPGVDVDCGQSVSYNFSTWYETDVFRTWISPKSDVTFSLCASPNDFNTKLTLYDYTTQIMQDECDAYLDDGGCSHCPPNSLQETWNITLDQGFYYIEVYGYTAPGAYKLDVTCTPSPTTTSPTTNTPTTIFPTTSEPTTRAPTTNIPTTTPSNVPSRQPTTSIPTISPTTNIPTTISPTTISPTTNTPTTIFPTTSQPTTRQPTTRSPTTKIPTDAPTRQPSDAPTKSPIFAADGEAKDTVYNTSETGAHSAQRDGNNAGMDTVTMLLIIIVVLGVVILSGAVGCSLCFCKKKNREREQKEMLQLEIANVVPADDLNATTDVKRGQNGTNPVSKSGDCAGTGSAENILNEDEGDNDNEMYVTTDQEEISETPGSKTTKGNIELICVDFMESNNNGKGSDSEDVYIYESVSENESDQHDDVMEEMYDIQKNNKTAGITTKN